MESAGRTRKCRSKIACRGMMGLIIIGVAVGIHVEGELIEDIAAHIHAWINLQQLKAARAEADPIYLRLDKGE